MGTDPVQRIAKALEESEPDPVATIQRLVEVCGEELADELLYETLQIEKRGGLMVPDKNRRRTKGGVFFQLARDRLSSRKIKKIFPYHGPYTPRQKAPPWPELVALAAGMKHEPGEATRMKITLIGRPGRIVKKDGVVVATMQYNESPQLPKQLPKLPVINTVFTVFIAARQWRKVEELLAQDPEDKLVIEGYCFLDKQVKGISVFAKSVTTQVAQRELRARQREQAAQKE